LHPKERSHGTAWFCFGRKFVKGINGILIVGKFGFIVGGTVGVFAVAIYGGYMFTVVVGHFLVFLR
jgi:hypothetical protein